METKGRRGVEHQSIVGVYSQEKPAHGGGSAVPFCQLPPRPCHRLSAAAALLCQPHLGMAGKSSSHLTPHKPKHCPVLCMPDCHFRPCLAFPMGTGLAAKLECTRLFWSTRGLQGCCTAGLRAGCSQNTTTICYCC